MHEMARRVAEAWSRDGQADLDRVLEGVPRDDEPSWCAALVADAEARADRGLVPTLRDYLVRFPWLAPGSRAVQELLAVELAGLAEADASELASRYGERFADDVRLVGELVGVLRPVPQGPREPRPEARLGKYVLRQRLGAGSFGQVWLAWDVPLERFVALKLIAPSGAASAEASPTDEARASAGLSHPNVVSVQSVGRFPRPDDWLYIEMQVCGDPAPTPDSPRAVAVGQSLPDWARGRRLMARDIARLMAEVCRGVVAAHAQGVVHCDLKPSNVLVTPSGRPMVADFGLSSIAGAPLAAPSDRPGVARSVAVRTRSGQMVRGTPAYMSPEQARGEPARPISDVYGLGAVMYWLLSGNDPYTPAPSERLSDLLDRVGDPEAPPPPLPMGTPAALGRICRRAMARRPATRYPSAADMLADLEAVLGLRVPAGVGPDHRFQPLSLWVRRNAVAAGAGGAALAALALGLGVALWQSAAATEQRTIAEETVRFLNDDVLASADAERGGVGTRVVEVLHAARSRLDDRLGDVPAVRARVMRSLGEAYLAIGSPRDAEELLEGAVAVERRAGGVDPVLERKLIEARIRASAGEGDLARARAAHREAAQRFGADHPFSVDLANIVAGVLKNLAERASAERPSEAAALFDAARDEYTRVLESRRREPQPRPDDIPIVRHNLNLVMVGQASLAARLRPTENSRELWDRAIADRVDVTALTQRALGTDAEQSLTSEAELLRLYVRAGRYAEAVTAFPPLLERMRTALGFSHWRCIYATAQYGLALQGVGRLALAAEQLELAAEMNSATQGPAHDQTWKAGLRAVDCLERLAPPDTERARDLLGRLLERVMVYRPAKPGEAEMVATAIRQLTTRLDGLGGRSPSTKVAP